MGNNDNKTRLPNSYMCLAGIIMFYVPHPNYNRGHKIIGWGVSNANPIKFHFAHSPTFACHKMAARSVRSSDGLCICSLHSAPLLDTIHGEVNLSLVMIFAIFSHDFYEKINSRQWLTTFLLQR